MPQGVDRCVGYDTFGIESAGDFQVRALTRIEVDDQRVIRDRDFLLWHFHSA